MRKALQPQVEQIRQIAACLNPARDSRQERLQRFQALQQQFETSGDARQVHLSRTMLRFEPGLFLALEGKNVPCDNLDLERFFRLPKSHQRHRHGRAHTGSQLVREGPTLLPALEAHRDAAGPWGAAELMPFLKAQAPPGQVEATRQHRLIRRAKSKVKRTNLCAELEQRFQDAS